MIDPLADPGATFAPLGEGAERAKLPSLAAPHARRTAVAGLVSHLHRDHADAGALAGALSADAFVHEPLGPGGADVENLGLAQANLELERAELKRRAVVPWERLEVAPFTITALPAVDGLGDSLFHGYWWRMARRHGPFDVVFAPINGAVVNFPHLQPPSPLAAAMEPEQAAPRGHQTPPSNAGPARLGFRASISRPHARPRVKRNAPSPIEAMTCFRPKARERRAPG